VVGGRTSASASVRRKGMLLAARASGWRRRRSRRPAHLVPVGPARKNDSAATASTAEGLARGPGAPFGQVCTGCVHAGELGSGFRAVCRPLRGHGGPRDDLAPPSSCTNRRTPTPLRGDRCLWPTRGGLVPRDAAFTPTVHATRLGEALGMDRSLPKGRDGRLRTAPPRTGFGRVALAYMYEVRSARRVRNVIERAQLDGPYRHAIARIPASVLYLPETPLHGVTVRAGTRDRRGGEQVVEFVCRDASCRGVRSRAGLDERTASRRAGILQPGAPRGPERWPAEAADQVRGRSIVRPSGLQRDEVCRGVVRGAKQRRAGDARPLRACCACSRTPDARWPR